MQRVYVTGAAGFIGFHLSELLLKEGLRVHGYDGMTAYYDLALKRGRLAMLHQREGFGFTQAMLEDNARLAADMAAFKPDVVVHLAAQAGVRYSLEAPRSYLSSNIEGTFNVMEAARDCGVKHLLLASTSSVYGANTEMPYRETDKADTQVSLYAATKKATESLSHSWAHLWGLPTTCFRFFTVYGPWGRPDMAPFKFTKAILQGETIDVYGHGRMFRDFTYVTDLVRAIRLLMDKPPERPAAPDAIEEGDSLSPVAPWRVVNIGNGEKVALGDFIAAIEKATGRTAVRNLMEMQKGDVPATWADNRLLTRLTGYRPETGIAAGMAAFVAWYREHYGV
ncbi:MAG: GDP-mannose 4,6-dehydratase [Rhodobacteraceae bacterium]|jgi:UDP-glucuronate 4-epimerase|uniref:NAD-dependent epimerase/dehydratase family protein n=1 Tax=Albidovulum sp. TaxID=1872424 RepID=UPI001D8B50D3|nr:NAD-dependent epimerase/dehydratase family protein [uncultured Defluviimonas sp.]MCB2127118.1 GDP-mannose 4,6-dehydratase [Paracoccaceae bacterium]MCC0071134.1 GDP-mannose 4,6-dehydratase [Paracoccaceae bacterium]